MQLVEKGKLTLQDTVQKFITDFPYKGHTITIEHLLTHTSGLKDYITIDHPDLYIERHDLTPAIIIDHFKNAPLEFTPGSRYGYSSSGYVLLGAIIEKVSGQSYHQYMKDYVIDAAGLKHTSFAVEKNIVPKRVAGYSRDEGFYENTYYQTTSLGFAAGDLLSTVGDLFAWNQALMNNKLIKKPLLEKAFSRYRLTNGGYTNYGYGWQLDSLDGRRCIYHAGQVSGFIAFEWFFPAEDVFVSLCTNVKSGEDKTSFSDNRFRLFFSIPSLVFGNKIGGEITLNNTILDRYTGKYEMNGRKCSIYREKERLYLELGGAFALHPVSETRFFVAGTPTATWIDFTMDKAGKTTGMIVSQNGKYEWRKTE